MFESSPQLLKIWQSINDDVFAGTLPPLAAIGWQDLSSDADAADLYAGYSARLNVIGITHELRRWEEVGVELERLKSQGKEARAALEAYLDENTPLLSAVLGLVAHETAHQAADRFDKDAQSHGEAFIKQVRKIAKALDLPDVTSASAATWPNVLPLIQQERRRVGADPKA